MISQDNHVRSNHEKKAVLVNHMIKVSSAHEEEAMTETEVHDHEMTVVVVPEVTIHWQDNSKEKIKKKEVKVDSAAPKSASVDKNF